jgi:hypothetical protein
MSAYHTLVVTVRVEILSRDAGELSTDELFGKYREELVSALYSDGADREFCLPDMAVLPPTR